MPAQPPARALSLADASRALALMGGDATMAEGDDDSDEEEGEAQAERDSWVRRERTTSRARTMSHPGVVDAASHAQPDRASPRARPSHLALVWAKEGETGQAEEATARTVTL